MKARTVLFLLCALCAAACGLGPAEDVYPGAPVVLISIDTLRSDRLPVYGYGGVETPAIDALRADAILFERAYCHYPLTLPSHASILTGLLPTEHGVRDNVGYRLDTSSIPFLPRFYRERGYRTAGAVSAYILRGDTGIGDGFDFYEDSLTLRGGVSLGENQRPGSETARRAIAWLEEAAGDPFFLFVHVYEPHTPYSPPEPFASRYRDEPYDGEVAASDAVVGELVAALKRLGVYDRAVVALLSDHGEGLSDHGEIEHGILLYREVLQVPLLLKLPGSRHGGASVAAPAQLVDLAPTLMALAGAPAQERTTLLDLLAGAAPPRAVYAETYYPRIHLGWSDLASLLDGDLHYLEGPAPELYDLAADPAEKTNVLAERRGEYRDLRDRLAAMRTELEAPAQVDAETRERLAALGYLGTAVTVDDGPLPDPKAHLHVLSDLMAASRYQVQRDFSRAIATFRQVLAEQPNLVDAWENLAQCLHQVSRYEEAAAAYEKALELSRGADHVALGAARLFLEMERYGDARGHAELALATNPAAAHLMLARVAFYQDDLERAEAEAQRSLEARSNTAAPHVVLAQVAGERGELAAAAEHVERAEREEAKRQAGEVTPGLHYVKGNLEARLGNAEAAEASFREEIRHHPSDTRAYSELALLLALDGRPQEAVAALREMVETNQAPAAYAAAVETLRVLGDPRSAAGLLGVALKRYPGNPKLTALLSEGS
ncbi:MAG TPA: sulfatase-like hydrolase/transferase [Thermoanaerobaculia bacterium]